ncbi:hypothetical protein [uncultured Tateyamaria sp.]|uniref:hypothetical protein n=1 Tax=uncultured Tateyamaria sp. TaxID=455651 RepID=UPI00262C0572|nr:hypothetical protein [uncultured Tateyamaria sp.]
MNAMGGDLPEEPGGGAEPDIILISLERKTFCLYKGEQYLDQLLLTDGEYPKPVLCVHFESVFAAKRILGDSFSLPQYWGIHPDIVARLRDTDCLIETEA